MRIVVDPRVMSGDERALEDLLRSDEIATRSRREVAGLESAKNRTYISLVESEKAAQRRRREPSNRQGPTSQPSTDIFEGTLSVSIVGGSDAQTKTLFDDLVKRLRATLAAETQRLRERMSQELTAAAAEASEIEKRCEDLSQNSMIAPGVRASSETLERMAASQQELEKESARLRMELAGHEARQAAILEQMAMLNKELQVTVESDAGTLALRKVVEVRRAALKRVAELQEKGMVTEAERQKAEADAAMAEADLSRMQQQTLQQGGGDQMSHLRNMLTEVAVELPDLNARLKMAEERIRSLRDQLPMVEERSRTIGGSLRRARRTLDAAQERRDELEDQLRTLREPEVTIIRGE